MDRRQFIQYLGAAAIGTLATPRLARAAQSWRFSFEDEARARLAQIATRTGSSLPLRAPSIRVEKSRRELILSSGSVVVERYPIALGTSPAGHKQHAGDHRTPEGRYFICTRNDQSAYHLFLGLSYPNARDARDARTRLGLDDATVHRFERAERDRDAPPWSTPLGGAVGIHGGGIGRDWTWGCVALEDSAIEELWLACPILTPVEIVA